MEAGRGAYNLVFDTVSQRNKCGKCRENTDRIDTY